MAANDIGRCEGVLSQCYLSKFESSGSTNDKRNVGTRAMASLGRKPPKGTSAKREHAQGNTLLAYRRRYRWRWPFPASSTGERITRDDVVVTSASQKRRNDGKTSTSQRPHVPADPRARALGIDGHLLACLPSDWRRRWLMSFAPLDTEKGYGGETRGSANVICSGSNRQLRRTIPSASALARSSPSEDILERVRDIRRRGRLHRLVSAVKRVQDSKAKHSCYLPSDRVRECVGERLWPPVNG